MIFAYLGYSARAGLETVKKHVNSLNLKQGKMEQLLQWCGYSDFTDILCTPIRLHTEDIMKKEQEQAGRNRLRAGYDPPACMG